MNKHVVRALAWDAFYEVVDNWVFRILALLTAVLILLTFLVGLREEGLVLFFGFKTWSYADLFGSFGGMAVLAPAEQRALVIEVVLQIVIDFLAGSMGMLLSIAATAFFVPRLLEKGAADLYFHKPVSRWALYLSRYFAGLLFVALVAVFLVGGMYAGLLLVSGHNDPGILVGSLNLIYVFALVYSFSMLAGVATRSTVASILLASLFFFSNGCIHQTWIFMQQRANGPRIELHGEDDESDKPQTPNATGAVERGEHRELETEPTEPPSVLGKIFRTTLDVLHYTLPKTSDAEVFGQKLRKALKRPEFQDEGSLVTVFRLPEDFERVSDEALPALAPTPLVELLGEPRFGASSQTGVPTTFSLWRRPIERSEGHIGGRVREETTSQSGQKLEKLLATEGTIREVARESTRFGSRLGRGDISASFVHWKQDGASTPHTRAALTFKGATGEHVYTLLVDVAGELSAEDLSVTRERLTSRVGIDARALEEWYPSQLGFTAPLPYNIFFSIGSSLVFALAMLLLGRWRLARIAL